MQRTLLTLALIATAGVSHAQTMPAGEPVDAYGRPLIGRNDWVRQPGDQPGPGGNAAMPSAGMRSGSAAMNYGGTVATAPAAQPMAAQPMATQPMATSEKTTRNNKLERDHAIGPEPVPMDAAGSRQATFKDEYGFRYDSQGNRLDARGNVISPHIPQR
jgi:hypothetical protein